MAKTNEALNAALRQDFPAFVAKTFQTLNPGAAYLENWHIEAIAYQLERIRRGDNTRLMINVPPRSLKSIMASVAWPAFILGHNPTRSIMIVSHNLELATKLSNDFRKIVATSWYKQAFPTMKGAPSKDTERIFATTKGGGRYAHSVESGVTGQGADIIVLDDPLDASEAQNEVACIKVNNWIDTTLSTRLNNPTKDPIILVMQRLSIWDPCAHLYGQEKWKRLVLPAQFDKATEISVSDTLFADIPAEFLLHEDRMDEKFLAAQQAKMGKSAFLAQYQQCPVPDGGGLIDIGTFARFSILPKVWDYRFISVDAASGSQSGSYSVIMECLISDGKLYIINVERGYWQLPSLFGKVIKWRQKNPTGYVLVENAYAGTFLLELLFEKYGYVEFNHQIWRTQPIKSKIDRASKSMVVVGLGKVLLPNNAPWLSTLITEFQSFPDGANDDQVDAFSQAVKALTIMMKRKGRPVL